MQRFRVVVVTELVAENMTEAKRLARFAAERFGGENDIIINIARIMGKAGPGTNRHDTAHSVEFTVTAPNRRPVG